MGMARMLSTDAAATAQHITPDLSSAPKAWLANVSKADDTPSRKYLHWPPMSRPRLSKDTMRC